MQKDLEKEELDNGSNAASLTRIKVRKDKNEVSSSPPKVGDITERLAALARELDEFDDTPAETRSVPIQNTPKPSTANGWAPGQADRRRSSADRAAAAANGWGKKPTQPDILNYWLDIRGGSRRYPSWRALETDYIGKHWPNCVLIHCNREIGRLQVQYEFTHAIRKTGSEHESADSLGHIEFTPMIIDWILGIGQTVAGSRKPAHATEFFPTVSGESPLRVIALPLSETGKDIDDVLCYIQKLQ